MRDSFKKVLRPGCFIKLTNTIYLSDIYLTASTTPTSNSATQLIDI